MKPVTRKELRAIAARARDHARTYNADAAKPKPRTVTVPEQTYLVKIGNPRKFEELRAKMAPARRRANRAAAKKTLREMDRDFFTWFESQPRFVALTSERDRKRLAAASRADRRSR